MDKAALRPVVFEILRRTHQTHLHAIENEIRQRVDGYERSDALLVHEAVWELLVQGVLAPGKNSLNLHLPFVHVTEYGARCLEEETILAHDPDAYVARTVARSRGRASALVTESVRDAQFAYGRGLYRVVVVLLARAADGLRAALAASLAAHPGIDGSSFGAMREELARLDLTPEILRDLDSQLGGLDTLISLSRDRMGVPRLPDVDRDRALAFLLLFPEQCGFVYHLMDAVERSRRPAT